MYYSEAYLSDIRQRALVRQHELAGYSIDHADRLLTGVFSLQRTLLGRGGELWSASLGDSGARRDWQPWLALLADARVRELGAALVHQQIVALSGLSERLIDWSAEHYHRLHAFAGEMLAHAEKATPREGELPLRALKAAVGTADTVGVELAEAAHRTVESVAGDLDALVERVEEDEGGEDGKTAAVPSRRGTRRR